MISCFLKPWKPVFIHFTTPRYLKQNKENTGTPWENIGKMRLKKLENVGVLCTYVLDVGFYESLIAGFRNFELRNLQILKL